MTHPRLAEAMMDPGIYPVIPGNVEMIQTHISYIFIAGDFVYKVKKAVNFGFLDFTTLERRKYYCDEELRLNQRLAPDIYLKVVPIFESDGEIHLKGEGRIVEYAVLMRRLPRERMLKTLLREGKADSSTMEEIALKLADFHARAATGGDIDRIGGIETVRYNHDENFEQTRKYVRITIPEGKYQFLKDYVHHFMEKYSSLLSRRVVEHRIRDCHGDLHLEHICVTDGIVIFDCIEFNERFRYSDVASEVAFLSMDLDFNGFTEYAQIFETAYIRYSGDQELGLLLNFYKCYRAYVRGKVISFRIDEPEIDEKERLSTVATASNYFDLAYAYAARPEKPALILISGLMGTGKSVLARNIAPLLGAEVIRSDVLRKTMLGIAPDERRYENFGSGIYSEKVSDRVYTRAVELAEEKLGRGKSVIIDASYKRRKERLKAGAAASRMNADFFIVECVCPESVIEQRLTSRMSQKDEASDGRWEIFHAQKADFDPITEIPEGRHIVVDTSLTPEESAVEAIRGIRLSR